jgi:hypothetical protein
MKHLAIALALGLTGCVPEVPATIPPPPAPLAATVIDDQALIAADKGFDVALDAINLLIDHKVIVPGSQRAKSIAFAIRKVDSGLTVAYNAAEAGHATTYKEALGHAQAGITELRALLRSN